MNLGFVVGEFNSHITLPMLEVARSHADFLGANVVEVLFSPGAFDMPLLIKKLLKREDIDAVVTLGAVIEGDTQHDELVAQHASRKMADLSIEYEKPVSLGIIGPGVTRVQAEQRIDGYAKRAIESAVKVRERSMKQ